MQFNGTVTLALFVTVFKIWPVFRWKTHIIFYSR